MDDGVVVDAAVAVDHGWCRGGYFVVMNHSVVLDAAVAMNHDVAADHGVTVEKLGCIGRE